MVTNISMTDFLSSFDLLYLAGPSIHTTFYIGNGEALGAEKLTGRGRTYSSLTDDMVFMVRFEFFVALLQGT